MSELWNKTFTTKYIFRFLHIAPMVALAGKIITDYLFPSLKQPLPSSAKAFYAISGIVMMIGGLVNTFLLKPKDNMGPNAKLWLALAHSKLLLSVLIFTPIANVVDESVRLPVQFWTVVAFLFLSPFLRFYREHYTALRRQGDGRYELNETQ